MGEQCLSSRCPRERRRDADAVHLDRGPGAVAAKPDRRGARHTGAGEPPTLAGRRLQRVRVRTGARVGRRIATWRTCDAGGNAAPAPAGRRFGSLPCAGRKPQPPIINS